MNLASGRRGRRFSEVQQRLGVELLCEPLERFGIDVHLDADLRMAHDAHRHPECTSRAASSLAQARLRSCTASLRSPALRGRILASGRRV
jgi:hypothetical protein